jgi:hypothetical protein
LQIKTKGSILQIGGVGFVPYGISFDGNHTLWTTSFYTNKLYKLNTQTFNVDETIPLQGDSLFTDIALDKVNNIFYLHHMNGSNDVGGEIQTLDMNGNLIRRYKSPAGAYPIGLELVDGKLLVGDRDGTQYLFLIDPKTGTVYNHYQNPFSLNYGPRGLGYDGSKYVYQVCTDFPSSSSPLTASYVMRIDKNSLGTEYDRMPLEGPFGIINARGVDYDPTDGNIWITDFGGNIYKIAGFDTKVEVEEPNSLNSVSKEISTNIYPNPSNDYVNISLEKIYEGGQYKIEIADILGEKLGTFFDKYIEIGNTGFVSVNTSGFPTGIYSVIVLLDEKIIKYEKLEIIK